MPNAAIKATAYCLSHTPELGFHYGSTPYWERRDHPDSQFLKDLPEFMKPYESAASYPPNLTYIGAMTVAELERRPLPWYENPADLQRYGRYGEIMPEDEFLGLMEICDVFDLIWLEEGFAASIRAKLEGHPVLADPALLKRLSPGRDSAAIEAETVKAGALPLHFGGRVVGCCRSGHEVDENLSAHVILENLSCKAGGVLSLMHLLKDSGLAPADVDFVIETSEEATGDMNQRGGGNFAKSVAEICGCINASGCDVRGFCAGPTHGIISAASMVAAGTYKNVVVLAGGAIPKLFMNAREHVKKHSPALEDCQGSFAFWFAADDGIDPIIRLDCVGKHSVGAGASPQAVTTALVFEPLCKAGLGFNDVDKYAPELHIPEITVPAGAGDVPKGNYKMIAALAVMKGQLERTAIDDFVKRHGLPGFAHTQGHIPSGVPYLGHARDSILAGEIRRALIIGKGSLFLGRLTNLADGASFLVELPSGRPETGLTRDDVKRVLLEVLGEAADALQKTE